MDAHLMQIRIFLRSNHFKTVFKMIVKAIAVITTIYFLSGCTTYLAHKIAVPSQNKIDGDDLSELFHVEAVCDNNENCISLLTQADIHKKSKAQEQTPATLTLSFNIGDAVKTWRFEAHNKALATQKMEGQLVVIFPGYRMNPQLLFLTQRWLNHVTGADVVIAPNPDDSEAFSFGLNHVLPVQQFIKSNNASHIHIVGLSMGAVAAAQLAEKAEVDSLFLVAPMTNFKSSLNAVYTKYSANSLLSWLMGWLISAEDIEDVSELVLENANLTMASIDVQNKLAFSKASKINVYVSPNDDVVSGSFIDTPNQLGRKDVVIRRYNNLSHAEMLGLLDESLLADFLSDLTNIHVDTNDTSVIGKICRDNSTECKID